MLFNSWGKKFNQSSTAAPSISVTCPKRGIETGFVNKHEHFAENERGIRFLLDRQN